MLSKLKELFTKKGVELIVPSTMSEEGQKLYDHLEGMSSDFPMIVHSFLPEGNRLSFLIEGAIFTSTERFIMGNGFRHSICINGDTILEGYDARCIKYLILKIYHTQLEELSLELDNLNGVEKKKAIESFLKLKVGENK